MAEKNIRFRQLFNEGTTMPVLDYRHTGADLCAWARSTFGIEALEDLHRLPDPIAFANYVERLYYRIGQLKSTAGQIRETTEKIKEELLVPLCGEIRKFQFPPSIRCHLSGAGTASAFHRDGDAKYGVAPGTLNLWIPLTKVWGNNSIHIEDRPGSGNYRAVTLEPGELLIFDAYHLLHGSYANDTPSSRISIDIRFIPEDPEIANKLGIYAK